MSGSWQRDCLAFARIVSPWAGSCIPGPGLLINTCGLASQTLSRFASPPRLADPCGRVWPALLCVHWRPRPGVWPHALCYPTSFCLFLASLQPPGCRQLGETLPHASTGAGICPVKSCSQRADQARGTSLGSVPPRQSHKDAKAWSSWPTPLFSCLLWLAVVPSP